MKKLLAAAVIVLFIGASVVQSTVWVEESTIGRAILYVGGSGPGNYTTIQAAIDDAVEGDTVFVYNGTYHEHITIGKSYLNLIGENRDTTIIDADGYGQGVDGAGLSIPEYRHHNFVSGLTVMNTTYVGIFIHSEPAHSGAHCDYNTISDCIVRDCTGVGGIRIIGRRWTCHADYNTVINCEVYNVSGVGLLIHAGEGYSYHNQIINTKSYNNTVGIYVGSSQTDGSIISKCTIFNNTEYGLKIESSDTTVYHNNLLNNGQNTFDSGTNTWYNATLQEGNYYDDYTGIDANGDGIGDTPYNIPGGSNQDLYPLMYPWYPTHPDTVYVDDDYDNSTPGWGYDRFNRIQYGINEVPENGTVYVYNGTYYENVVIDKPINLIGYNRNNTIINGNGSGDVIHITGEMVNVSEFSITNSGSDNFDAGIEIVTPSKYCNISNNNIYKNNVRGIWLLDAHNNRIINNNISSNKIYGIQISHSNDNNVSKNTILVNNTCVYIYTGINNSISENILTSNNRFGISLWSDSYGNTILNNFINSYQDNGIEFWLSYSNIFVGNYINSHNFYCINFRDSTNNNHFYHNNFFSNKETNAYDLGNNIWDDGYPSGGNYWSNYTGDDLYSGPNQDIPGPDGIGDIPYNISGGDNQDMYPFMEPNGWINSPPNIPDRPSGEVIVLPGVEHTYTTSTIDPDSDSIWFKWDWGDGTYTDWLGPYDSGEEASATASWSQGTYQIRVKAKDNRNPETEWSESLTVNIIYPNFETVFLFGQIGNLNESSELSSFNAVKLLWINFNPIFPQILTSNEAIVVSNKYFGILRPSFMFGFFNAMILT